MDQKLEIKKFDISKMKSDSVVVMLAKRNSGKSFLCRDILHNHRHIPSGIIISPTEKANPFYKDFIPDLFIHYDYSAGLVGKFLKRQEKMMKKPDSDARAFLVMDDCLYDNKWTKDVPIRNIFMNGRHYKVLYLLMMQYPLGITPALRSNIDYVFLLKENNYSNRKKLYEHYAGVFPTFQLFCETLDKCTTDYSCLVIDNTSNSGKLEDMIFWYKAQSHPELKVGSRKYWDYHKSNFNIDYKEKVAKAAEKGKGTKYNIKKTGI